MTYIGPNGKKNVFEITTDVNSTYHNAYKPTEIGSWIIEAAWSGDAGHNPSKSITNSLSVKNQLKPEIPFLSPTHIVLGIITAIFLHSLSKKR